MTTIESALNPAITLEQVTAEELSVMAGRLAFDTLIPYMEENPPAPAPTPPPAPLPKRDPPPADNKPQRYGKRPS